MLTHKKIPSSFCAVILAGGEGVRMRSVIPKVLHLVGGAPLIEWVVSAVKGTHIQKICIVLGKGRDKVKSFLNSSKLIQGIRVAIQKKQLGSGHALMQAAGFLKRSKKNYCLVVCGDTPFLEGATLEDLMTLHRDTRACATVLSTTMANPGGYGRIVRDTGGSVKAVVEEQDASPQEKSIREINTGVYCFEIPALLHALKKIRPDNVKKEFYLTDVLHIFRQSGSRVSALCIDDAGQVMGINSRVQLARAEEILRRRRRSI